MNFLRCAANSFGSASEREEALGEVGPHLLVGEPPRAAPSAHSASSRGVAARCCPDASACASVSSTVIVRGAANARGTRANAKSTAAGPSYTSSASCSAPASATRTPAADTRVGSPSAVETAA